MSRMKVADHWSTRCQERHTQARIDQGSRILPATLKAYGGPTMPFSLYDATAASFLQGLAALDAILDRAQVHFQQQGTPLADIVGARLAPDMLPFSFQIVSAAHHSMGALSAARQGLFKPPSPPDGLDFAALQALIAQARQSLAQLGRDEVNALEGNDMVFQLGERRLPFLVEDFLLSFSLPNFYFHTLDRRCRCSARREREYSLRNGPVQ
jgi:hypothetical protein